MKKRTLTIAVGLTLMAGLLLITGTASAQAIKTPIEGNWLAPARLWPPEREWVDEDGILHVRNQKFRSRHGGGDIEGREIGWESRDVDLAAGLMSGHGYNYFIGTVLGDPAEAVGRYSWECTRIEGAWICTSTHTWHVNDGSLIKFSGTVEAGVYPQPYSGIHVDTPGGESRQGPRRRR